MKKPNFSILEQAGLWVRGGHGPLNGERLPLQSLQEGRVRPTPKQRRLSSLVRARIWFIMTLLPKVLLFISPSQTLVRLCGRPMAADSKWNGP